MKLENVNENAKVLYEYIRVIKDIENVKMCTERHQLEHVCHTAQIEIAIPILDGLKNDAISKLEKRLAGLEILVKNMA